MDRPERDLTFREAIGLHIWRVGFELEQSLTGLAYGMAGVAASLTEFAAVVARERAAGYLRERRSRCRTRRREGARLWSVDDRRCPAPPVCHC